jgi:hypothetical protein|tara:strand:+ start:2041 stop:2403 length:363 start_codon:yes stop_codon:yes gene_type:complete
MPQVFSPGEAVNAFDGAWRLLKEKKEKQNIHWMSPRNTGDSETPLGWINGHGPYIDLHELLADDPDGFHQTVSGHEEKGPLPWKNHEIVDGEVQEKDLSGPVPGLPGMSFDAKGNLVGGQ